MIRLIYYLVVAWNSNVNQFQRTVRVAECDHGDVHVGCLRHCLVVNAWVGDDQQTRFLECTLDLIRKCACHE